MPRHATILMGLTVTLAACGGSGGSSDPGTPGATPAPINPSPVVPVDPSPAASLASRLGRGNRLLIGLGGLNDADTILAQNLRIDVFDRYLPDFPGSSWVDYNSPPGEYVRVVADQADRLGAMPMFTLYQMALNGDGDLSILANRAQMQTYWEHAALLFDRLGDYGKPALVNLEPDFWGYLELQAPDQDPRRVFAHVDLAPDCVDLPNTAAGVGRCLLAIARARAPNAYVGFPPGGFGTPDDEVVRLMNRVGANQADFIVMQTSDRDAGCYEVRAPECGNPFGGPYWTAADYDTHFTTARAWHEGIGRLPLLWWQTPMGVPSTDPGTPGRYRDNHVDTFLRHAENLVSAGGVGVVFSGGAENQTTIETDGGHFRERLDAYLGDPVPLQ